MSRDDVKAPAMLDNLRALESRHIVPTYKRQPVVFVRGSGARLYDAEGREYLDLLSGIGVASLGHAHPGLASVLADQASTLLHTSNLYYHPLQGEAAARLSALSGLARTFFCNSGTEAVEACLKFARRFWYSQGRRDRTEYVALEGSFSGRTFGSLSVTHDEHYRQPFMPLLAGVTFVDPNDSTAIRRAVTDRTAAIIVEPIQGEGGVRPLPAPAVDALNAACSETGTLLIADEVQTGLGRTGVPFYFQALGLHPDLVAVGKALGGGVPIGACLCSERVATAISPGDHGTTYGGNLLACRAAVFFLQQLTEGGLIDHVNRIAPDFERRLRTLALRHPLVVEVRGAGLMRGLELRVDATPVIDLARQQGLLVNRTDEKVVRMLPPLTIDAADLERALDILDTVLTAVGAEVHA
jgi:predicted acetylornithine/succinylornithine family transaminase